MTPPSCCRSPCSHRTEEKSCRDRKGEDNSAAAGASYRRLGICDGRIGTLLGIRPRQTGCRSHHLCEIGAVVSGHAKWLDEIKRMRPASARSGARSTFAARLERYGSSLNRLRIPKSEGF